eukprot:CAMPEP_0204303810 /NCGR_PEP_ID=MMETSP0468-20130131/84096_1 /ASSEMBLY_ACC=CAM_ASM_000383 /TAXON_ID=2969 /ORGANISM="Oxyrrhis marina" /LENGTH=563 /DNA_ID=CAMNT_0051283129 /DNA_START=40 /DNA_END=1731 /DNA_ORIENTATION=-
MSLSPQKKVTIPAIFQQDSEGPRAGVVKAQQQKLERALAEDFPVKGSVGSIVQRFGGSPTKRRTVGGYPVILGAEGKVGWSVPASKLAGVCEELGPAGPEASAAAAEPEAPVAAAEPEAPVAAAEPEAPVAAAEPEAPVAAAEPEAPVAAAEPEASVAVERPVQAARRPDHQPTEEEMAEFARRMARPPLPDARAVRKQPTTMWDMSDDGSDSMSDFDPDAEMDFTPQATKPSSEFRVPPRVPGTNLTAPAVQDQQYIVTIAPAGITAFELLPADPPEKAAGRAKPEIAERLGEALSSDRASVKWIAALGAGAFATVFQAVVETCDFGSDRVAPGDLIAVKVIDMSGSRAGLGRKEVQEAEIAMRLDHPNIAKTFGFVQSPARLMVYIEHIAGGTLERLLACYGAISEARARQLVSEILAGLEHLHGHQICHRDLKPANILLSTGGVKLVDFGTSKAGMCKSLVGTHFYMAPEVRGMADFECTEDSYVGSAADIWSFGCTVIEVLTGCRPVAIRHDRTMTNPLLPETASADVLDLLQSTVHKTVSKRPTATELLGHKWLAAAP